jgi:hypothetical protein
MIIRILSGILKIRYVELGARRDDRGSALTTMLTQTRSSMSKGAILTLLSASASID